MPANVGEMFYTGDVPWHGLGIALAQPASIDEALKVGGLDWRVDAVPLLTADDPPSPVHQRKAIVRGDLPAGHDDRALGVAHRGFTPIQNRDAGLLFDAIFGRGRRVYHTGGYLGRGEVVWLLAKIDRTRRIAGDDIVEPYALMANRHDGSVAFNIRLTTVRVVCQNTLAAALNQNLGTEFRRAHQGSFALHAAAAHAFFSAAIHQLDSINNAFVRLSRVRCPDDVFVRILTTLIPDPARPRNAHLHPGLRIMWERKIEAARAARNRIAELRTTGKGQDLNGSEGTYWGVLNAVTEYVDHYHATEQSRIAYALLGDGMELKRRAFWQVQSAVDNVAYGRGWLVFPGSTGSDRMLCPAHPARTRRRACGRPPRSPGRLDMCGRQRLSVS